MGNFAADFVYGTAVTLALDDLFHVNDNAAPLGAKKAGYFHSMIARLLSANNRVRPDVQVSVAF